MINRPPQIVMFEVTNPERPPAKLAGRRRAGEAAAALATVAALDLGEVSRAMAGMVDVLAETFRPKEDGAKETEIEFALAVKADGSLIIAKMGASFSMKVKVKFDRA